MLTTDGAYMTKESHDNQILNTAPFSAKSYLHKTCIDSRLRGRLPGNYLCNMPVIGGYNKTIKDYRVNDG